jgi:hypothetical protein
MIAALMLRLLYLIFLQVLGKHGRNAARRRAGEHGAAGGARFGGGVWLEGPTGELSRAWHRAVQATPRLVESISWAETHSLPLSADES